ncbi:MAG TPA: site-2 protease family protein [bacterium]|nr:site-2 protease family protein [bacterium]
MFRTNIRLFRAFGIPIELNITWFIVFALVAWSLVSLYFPTNYPGYSVTSHWIMGIVAALLLFTSVVLHELGHSYVAKTHGVPIRRITLFLFGGVSQLAKESADPVTEIKIAAAGPGVSFVLMAIFGACYVLGSRGHVLTAAVPVLKYLAYVNGILGAFNLIPGFPLDGGRLLRAGIWKATGDLRRSTYVATRVGSIVGIGFIALGFLSVFRGQFVYGLWMVMIGFFLRQAAEASYFQVVTEGALKGIKVEEVMKTDVVTVPGNMTITDLVDDYFFKYHYDCFPVAEDGRLRGLVTLNEVKKVARDKWGSTLVSDVMQRDLETLSVTPKDDVSAVLARVIRDRCGRLPVVDGDRVIGIITRRDILEALKVISDLG